MFRSQRYGRICKSLAILVVAWLSITPSNAAFVDQPEGGLTKIACHDEATVLLVAGQFGLVLVVSGQSAPVLADVAWRMIEKRPPVVSKVCVVIAKNGLVRLYAVNRGCVRRSAATLGTWSMILGEALERFQTERVKSEARAAAP